MKGVVFCAFEEAGLKRYQRSRRPQVRTGRSPENMATLRDLAMNTVRAADRQNIAAGLRRAVHPPLDLLAISGPLKWSGPEVLGGR